MRVIEMTVSPTGDVTLRTKGYEGQTCRDASRALEQALGDVTDDRPSLDLAQTSQAEQRLGS